MFVASSLAEATCVNIFLERLPPPCAQQAPPFQEPCLWRFHLDGSLPESARCVRQRPLNRYMT